MAAVDVALPERMDIHRACKSLETLLGVLNDYCEAAGTIVILQRKLAKALRETAGMKTTGNIPANVLNASATIFETSVEVNTKFAKFADKEYDSLSAEVKKWFKKLAKEEKLHDERLSAANAKIKQVGQSYEKKSKKSPHDATEEHARYINLISTLGPEISREKHNHALVVNQRHTLTTYGTASTLSRIADAEWLRMCECVRRFAPTITQLGEWRSLCEGGWRGPAPEDLPDPDGFEHVSPRRQDHHAETINYPPNLDHQNLRDSPTQRRSWAEMFREAQPPSQNRSQTSLPNVASDSINQDPGSSKPAVLGVPSRALDEKNTDSVRSLSAFPLPPTHFPLPPPRQEPSSQSSSSAVNNSPTILRFTDSPLPASETHSGDPSQHNSSPSIPSALPSQQVATIYENAAASENRMEEPTTARLPPVRSQTLPTAVSDSPTKVDMKMPIPSKPFSPPSPGAQMDIELGIKEDHTDPRRSETTRSSGSIVAALRDRFSQIAEATTPSPKDRDTPTASPIGVNNLASRYQTPSPDSPSSPRLRPPSTSFTRQTQLAVGDTLEPSREQQRAGTSEAAKHHHGSPQRLDAREEEAARRYQQRIDDLARLELKEKELELLQRERDLERRVRELAFNQARLNDDSRYPPLPRSPIPSRSSQPTLRPRDRTLSFQASLAPQPETRPGDIDPTPSAINHRVYTSHRSSYSASNLAPPPSLTSGRTAFSHDGQSTLESHSYTAIEPHILVPDTRTRSSPTPPQLMDTRQVAKAPEFREKPKTGGWMRRLSVPVGSAFGLESKKVLPPSPVSGLVGKSGALTLDGKRGISSPALRSRALESRQ